MKLLVRWAVTVLALVAAVWLVPGIQVEGTAWVAYAVMAVVLALINTIVRPVLKFLSCPLIIVTLGLFVLIVNGATLWLAAWIANQFGIGFYVDGFWAAFFGALIVSVVSIILSAFVKDSKWGGAFRIVSAIGGNFGKARNRSEDN